MDKQNLKRAQDEQFSWIGGEQLRYRLSDRDVVINKVKANRKGDPFRYSVTFKNRAYDWLKDIERVQFAIFKNRIMWRESDEGFTLSCKKKESSRGTKSYYASIPYSEASMELDKFIGDYELKYDDFYDLYYIEK